MRFRIGGLLVNVFGLRLGLGGTLMLLKANNISLFYEKSGSGPPLLLLHGNGEDHHIFDKLGEKLCNNFTLYAIDSRGHGQSEPSETFSYDIMAEDIYSFIVTLDLQKVDIIGFSDGAILALVLSLKHPEVINKMALLGVNLTPEDFTDESLVYIKALYEETKSPLIKMMLVEPNIELTALKDINIPAYVIAGENDLFKPEVFIQVAKALPQSQLKILKGHTHESYIVGNDLLYADFLSFFKFHGPTV
jgi:pimeloyl-ACP methyl ester carboxylesterase